jgi:hypothetical protein
LEAITPKDITMLKSLQKANAVTLMVMTTVCILMRVTAVGKMNPET